MSKSPKNTKGPVVKSGPTRGKNRSRTQGGQWRAKRNDSGKSRSKGGGSGKKGCYLTTAACVGRGLPDDCRELQILRRFRDEVLAATPEGVALVSEYYDTAPGLVPLLDDRQISEAVWTGIEETIDFIEKDAPGQAVCRYRQIVRMLLREDSNAET